MLDLSVIMPHCGAQDMLDKCIASLPAACAGLKYELILVNNNPENEEMRCDHDAKIVRNIPGAFINHSWNQGCNIAEGHVFAVVNDDVIFGARSLSLCVKALAAFDMSSIYPSHTSEVFPDDFHSRAEQLAQKPLCLVGPPEVCGFAFIFTRSCFAAVGPFDSQFGHHYGDVDYWYRLVLAGRAPRQLENALIHHFGRFTFRRNDNGVSADIDPALVPGGYVHDGRSVVETAKERRMRKWKGVTGQELVERVYGKRPWDPTYVCPPPLRVRRHDPYFDRRVIVEEDA